MSLGPMACLSSFQSLFYESPVGGIPSTQDLGLFVPIEAVLLFLGRGEGSHSWMVKTESHGVKQCVIGPQLSKDSAAGFTIPCIHKCLFTLPYINKSLTRLGRHTWISLTTTSSAQTPLPWGTASGNRTSNGLKLQVKGIHLSFFKPLTWSQQH